MIDQSSIRSVMKALNPSVAHRAAETPDINEIYAPPSHADALDPDRALVVGSRGVGKSFWAAVLADPSTRIAAAEAYPKLNLNTFDVSLGFHEGSIAANSIAPTAPVLKKALELCDDPAWIWRSVVLRALNPTKGPDRLTERVKWLMDDPEEYAELISDAEERLLSAGRRSLVVFDALDVMANDWNTIRELTVGLARVALELVSSKTIRLKMFMRRDQFNDMRQKTFADFSKLRTAAVELDWSYKDLYGAFFSRLWQDKGSHDALVSLAVEASIASRKAEGVPASLREDEVTQERLFALIAGEFMGVNAKRGRTYLWLPRHLADGHGETSLRSFLIALKEAAENTSDHNPLAVDRVSINQGVLKASQTRREEIKEDHPWVEDAIPPLEGLIVPCADQELITRWYENNTVAKIRKRQDPERPAAPVQLSTLTDDTPQAAEAALLQALEELGVIERRGEGRVNVPDIFRVTAKIKRKGGLVPRRRS